MEVYFGKGQNNAKRFSDGNASANSKHRIVGRTTNSQSPCNNRSSVAVSSTVR